MSSNQTYAGSSSLLRFATAGSVDDGKSTLIGRLLHDTKSLLDDTIDAIEISTRRRGGEGLDLALVTDGLRAEREQGITIDVAHRYFATAKRSFIIADTPGHVQYTRNMVTGASTSDVAVILVDARHGLKEQSFRHASIASLLGIRHLVFAVNKMDLVDWSFDRYNEIELEIKELASRLQIDDFVSIPLSALTGANVVDAAEQLDWYVGPTLLEHLETVELTNNQSGGEPRGARLGVQWVVRPEAGSGDDRRWYCGAASGGTFTVGQRVVALPKGNASTVAAVSGSGAATRIQLTDEIDIARGDTIVDPEFPAIVTTDFDATICWMIDRPLVTGDYLFVKHGGRTVQAIAIELQQRLNIVTGESVASPTQLELNEIGVVRFRVAQPLVVDAYRDNRVTGAFIGIDSATNATALAGMIQ
jgi:sulfate adenylyltransferase large subunit